jgi:streptogramin lyase
VVLVIDDLETANALREALDDEAARHQFSADSWPAIARQLSSRPWWRTRAEQLAPAVTALVVVAAVIVVVIASRSGTSSSVGGPQRQPHHVLLEQDDVLRFLGTGHGIAWPAAGYGAIWVGGLGVRYRVNPATNRIVDTIETRKTGRLSRVTTGLGSVWISGSNPRGHGLCIYRIDPRSDRVTALIPLPGIGSPESLAAAYGSVWVTSTTDDGSVLRIDPKTDQVVGQPIQTTTSVPGAIVAGFGRIWVNAEGLKSPVTEINPATGKVIKRPSWGRLTDVSAIGDGSLWTLGKDRVHRVDPATGKVTASIVLSRPSQVVLVRGIAVVMTTRLAAVMPAPENAAAYLHAAICIDPATNKPACHPVQLGGLPVFLTPAPDGFWITNLTNRTLAHYTVTASRP